MSVAIPAGASVVHFKTSDGIRITSEYTPPKKGKMTFILLHGLGAGRGEWQVFRASLTALGHGSLALDARGHGESGGAEYRTFRSSSAWAALDGDLDAAAAFLQTKKVAPQHRVFVGASIGANLALRAAVRHPASPFVVLLSPGWDYQGILLEPAARACARPIIVAASPEDRYAFETLRRMSALVPNQSSILLAAPSGHGVNMFKGKEGGAFLADLLKRIESLIPPVKKHKKTEPPGGGERP